MAWYMAMGLWYFVGSASAWGMIPTCDLTGDWQAVSGDKGAIYNFVQTTGLDDEDQFVVTYEPAQTGQINIMNSSSILGHWKKCTGTIEGAHVVLHTDTGHVLTGNSINCSRIPWDHGPPWCRRNSSLCFPPKPTPPAPAPAVDHVKHVHVTSMNHLDLGFTLPGHKGATALEVLTQYVGPYFSKALDTADQLAKIGINYTYTTHAWLVSHVVDCPQGVSTKYPCPNASALNRFKAGVKSGAISWHAGAFNLEPEAIDNQTFRWQVQLGHHLDDMFGLPHKITMSQRDVPGLTRAAIPLLVQEGVQAVSVGVNTFSGPPFFDDQGPNTHRIFRWVDPPSNTSVLAMWHPRGYGGTRVADCVVLQNFSHALCPYFIGDNGGPPTAKQMANILSQLRKTFPKAVVEVSTFDNFVGALALEPAVREALPRSTLEVGDTWIWGLAQDPAKTAQMRALLRARRACSQQTQGVCDVNDPQIGNFTRALAKLSEHTWGYSWGFLSDHARWTNRQLRQALADDPHFAAYADSWVEQRSWTQHALDALSAAPSPSPSAQWLLANASDRLHAMATAAATPNVSGWTRVPASRATSTNFSCADMTLRFNSSGAATLWHSKGAMVIGQYKYRTLNQTDITAFMEDYLLVQRDVAFGKKNVSSAAPVSGLWLPTLASLYYQDTSTNPLGDTPGCSFWIELSMPTFLVRDYGTAEAVWVRLHVDGDGTIGANLRWIQKTATRLPEAHMLGFGAPGQSVGPWVVDKLGSYVDVRPTQMAPYCSTHLHAVGEGGVKDMDSGTTIRSLDAALVSLGRSANPYPSPVVHAGDPDATARDGAADGSGELNFVLQNNLWDTNYPVWFPFDAVGSNMEFRFRIDMR